MYNMYKVNYVLLIIKLNSCANVNNFMEPKLIKVFTFILFILLYYI